MEDLMDHFVKLEKLPEDFEIPGELKDRMHFNAERHELIFQGYMSKSEFDRMCQLTRDWKFRRTLEELFCLCVPDDGPRANVLRRFWDALMRRLIMG
jgi:hypothetical protein